MPDGISSALSSINPELQTGLGVAGLGSIGYNLYNQYQNQQYQNLLRSYAQDPTKMNAYAAQFTQPLNAGLTSAVANNTQGYLAEHGLTDSPAISQQVEAQAIAPYVQQNQQAGYSDALQALGLGGGAVNPNTSSANSIAALAKAFAALPGGLKSLSPTMLQQIQNISAPGIIPQGTPQGAAPGPIDTSGMAGDYSGLFPSTTPDVQPYTPDYISATGGGDPSLGVVGDYGG